MVIIGASGSGKTVLLKHIIGLLQPERGKVRIDSQDLSRLNETSLNQIRRKFGMLFQNAALFDSMTVWENVGFGHHQHSRLEDGEIREIALRKLAMVGLRGVEDLMPAQLSGGMRKRVGLARAIAMDPEILLYDEPTAGLDPIMADVINQLILELNQELHITTVAITHDMTSAYKIGDRIAMLYDGQIREMGSPQQIRESQDPVVRQFITGTAQGPIAAL